MNLMEFGSGKILKSEAGMRKSQKCSESIIINSTLDILHSAFLTPET
jgi:hypothetical protein